MLRDMGHPVLTRSKPERPGWAVLGLVLTVSFLTHAAAASICWLLVDSSDQAAWLTPDFERWAMLSASLAAVGVLLVAAVVRRWPIVLTSTVGFLAALLVEVAVFIGYALMNSA